VNSSPLPASWAIASIADVISDVPTTDPSAQPKATITYFDISSIDNDAGRVTAAKIVLGADAPSRARQIVQARDVLFSTVRPNLRAIALVPAVTNGIASTGFCVLRAAQSIDPNYIFYYARSEGFLDALLPMARGSSYPAVRSGDVVSQSIPIAPAAEQARIVAKLEELLSDLDAGVAELKAAQKKLGQYRQSLLKAAVEGALTAEWRAAQYAGSTGKTDKTVPVESGTALLARILTERRSRWETRQLAKFQAQGKPPPKDWQSKYPAPVAPDTTGLPTLPVGWVWASIEQIASDERYSLSIGPFGSNLKVPDYREEGVPLVFVRNIRSGHYGGINAKYVTPEKADELRAHSIAAGDVLITKMGEPPGDADVYPDDQPPAIITADCIKVRCWSGLMLPHFLKSVINSYIGQRQIEPMTQGVAQKKVSLGRFSNLAVPVPSSAEQVEIMKTVAAADSDAMGLDTALAHGLKQSEAQRKNILQAAFSGQLVPQDPADEPASALLTRIRAERAARETSAARGRGKKKVST
jgi:type I restriction enzyme S subunit